MAILELKEKPLSTMPRAANSCTAKEEPTFPSVDSEKESKRVVTANYANHVWHVDLTAVATLAGFWASWLPLALPQCWPFCWWVAVVLDHHSRRVMGVAVFKAVPTSKAIRAFLGRTIHEAGAGPST